jgi:hypothetical protein
VFRSKSRQRTLVWSRDITHRPRPVRKPNNHDDSGLEAYEMYSPPPPTFAFGHGQQRSSEGLPLIIVSPGAGASYSHSATYDPSFTSLRSGSMSSGYTGYHSVSSAERDIEMEILEGVAPETLVARRPVFPRESSEDFKDTEDQGREATGKDRE